MKSSHDMSDLQPDKHAVLEELHPPTAARVAEPPPPAQHSRFADSVGLCGVAIAPSGRSVCFFCSDKIPRGSLRLELIHNTRKPPRYLHITCGKRLNENPEFVAESVKWLRAQIDNQMQYHRELAEVEAVLA